MPSSYLANAFEILYRFHKNFSHKIGFHIVFFVICAFFFLLQNVNISKAFGEKRNALRFSLLHWKWCLNQENQKRDQRQIQKTKRITYQFSTNDFNPESYFKNVANQLFHWLPNYQMFLPFQSKTFQISRKRTENQTIQTCTILHLSNEYQNYFIAWYVFGCWYTILLWRKIGRVCLRCAVRGCSRSRNIKYEAQMLFLSLDRLFQYFSIRWKCIFCVQSENRCANKMRATMKVKKKAMKTMSNSIQHAFSLSLSLSYLNIQSLRVSHHLLLLRFYFLWIYFAKVFFLQSSLYFCKKNMKNKNLCHVWMI